MTILSKINRRQSIKLLALLGLGSQAAAPLANAVPATDPWKRGLVGEFAAHWARWRKG